MDAGERLAYILMERGIRPHPAYGGASLIPVTCLSECTPAGLKALVLLSRYEPFGIGFTKDYVFAAGGGPALYIRADEWESVSSLPDALKARSIRLWPGASATGTEVLPESLKSRSDWRHEREWRLRGPLSFDWLSVAFLIFPTPKDRLDVLCYADHHTDYYAEMEAIPFLLVDPKSGAMETHGIAL